MQSAEDFIRFALSHADKSTIPANAILPCELEECGTDPWLCIHGAGGDIATADFINEQYINFYSGIGWERRQFDDVVNRQLKIGSRAADCSGLLDAYLGLKMSPQEYYDVSYNRGIIGNLSLMTWVSCSENMLLPPETIGDAVFYRRFRLDEITHMGFVCGHTSDGETLVIEARGLRYGVVVSRMIDRPWTNRGTISFFESETETNTNSITKEDLYALFNSS